MSKITDYRVIQADGNRNLAEVVKRFIDKGEGWEPHESVILVGTKGPMTEPGMVHHEPPIRILCQPIVKREAEHAELKRLRELERHVSQIVDEIDHPITNDIGMLTWAHEELTKALRGGQYERKGE